MKTWNKIKMRARRILRWFKPSERQLRAMYRLGRITGKREAEHEHAHGFPVAPRKDFAQVEIIAPPPPIASYEPPAPTTDGKIQAEGIRQRALTRQLQRHPGVLMHHHDEMLKKRRITQKLDPTTTIILDNMPRNLMSLFENDKWLLR